MAKFMNVVTGNVLTVTDKDTIALMEKSKRYKAVAATKKTGGKKAPDSAEDTGDQTTE